MVSISAPEPPSAQLPMDGMPEPVRIGPATLHDLRPGQPVVYLGYVSGGPRHGSTGVVKKTLRRGAIVDLGPAGSWRIPLHFLTPISRAA